VAQAERPVLSRITLDDRGAIYLQAHLSGVNAFCSLLLDQVIGDAGEIFTLAPKGTSREQIYQLDSGGLPASPLLEQAHLLRQAVEAASGSVCIVDDFDLTWGETGSDDEANAFGVGEEVYRQLTAEDDVLTFAEVLSATHVRWHGVAAVCARAAELDGTQTSSLDSLAEAVETVSLITCVAYDGEGFVAWRRRSR
jgi:hypothetical protein